MSDTIWTMPAVALRGMTILPGMVAHFDISRERSVKAVEEAMMGDQNIFLVTQKNVEVNDPQIDDLYRVGLVAKIKQVIKMRNGIIRILVEGERRAELSGLLENMPYLMAEGMYFEEDQELYSEEAKEGMRRAVLEAYGRYAALNPKMDKDFMRQASETKEAETICASKIRTICISSAPLAVTT